MAKKKAGTGSNLGLIITLVFFVLSTVILGVTTYMGYSDIDAKEKSEAKAKAEKMQAEADSKWYRYQARYLRSVLGEPPAGVDAAELQKDKQDFDDNKMTFANNQKDREEFAGLTGKLNSRFPWNAAQSTAPATTVEQLLANKDQSIEGLKARLKKSDENASREKREREEAEANAAKEVASLKSALEDVKKKSLDDVNVSVASLTSQRDTVEKANREANDVRQKLDAAQKELEKQAGQVRRLTTELASSKRDTRSMREELEETRNRLTALLEKSGQDPRMVEQAVMDARSSQVLKEWTRDWRIVDIDRRGNLPYINLGSADGLSPQVTFSVHSAGLDGKLNPISKGTIEVVRIIGSNLAQGRITSIRDAARDPILKGDRLFNPTWDPNRKKHVAVAGLADLGGDNRSSTDDLRRVLARQNAVVDSYIDVSDEKGPKLVGPGITVNTDYLILADNLDMVNHPRARDKGFSQQFDKLIREMKEKASSNGVTVIPLQKYLDMIGFRSPKVISGGRTAGTPNAPYGR